MALEESEKIFSVQAKHCEVADMGGCPHDLSGAYINFFADRLVMTELLKRIRYRSYRHHFSGTKIFGGGFPNLLTSAASALKSIRVIQPGPSRRMRRT